MFDVIMSCNIIEMKGKDSLKFVIDYTMMREILYGKFTSKSVVVKDKPCLPWNLAMPYGVKVR